MVVGKYRQMVDRNLVSCAIDGRLKTQSSHNRVTFGKTSSNSLATPPNQTSRWARYDLYIIEDDEVTKCIESNERCGEQRNRYVYAMR